MWQGFCVLVGCGIRLSRSATTLTMPDPTNMSQDDIDALLAQMSGGSDQPAEPASAPPAPASDVPLSQDAIDTLISGLDAAKPGTTAATKAKAPETGPQESKTGNLVPLTKAETKPATAGPDNAAAAGKSPDALTRNQDKPAEDAASGDDKTLDQDEIDKLLSAVERKAIQKSGLPAPGGDGSSNERKATSAHAKPPTKSTAAPPPAATKTVAKPATQPVAAMAAPSGPLSQDDIDKLLSELGANITIKVEAKPDGTKAFVPGGTKSLAKAPPAVTGSVTKKTESAVAAPAATNPGTKRQMLDSSAVTAESPQPPGVRVSGPMPASPTLSLSTEELDALVTKQAGGDTQTGTEMIAQSDIDALVQQLATATTPPEGEDAKGTDAMAKHEGEIDKILAQGAASESATDSVDVKKILGIAPTPMPMHGPMLMPVSAPIDLRGAKWFLAAAVLMLATCAGALFFVVSAMGGLSDELRRERTAQLVPTDSYGEDFHAAKAQLSSTDAMTTEKAVQFLVRLKLRHPARRGEIALVLARFHRQAGRHGKAVEEFADAFDAGGMPAEPRLRLDYADSLARHGDQTRAISEIYALLSEEAGWVAERDDHGSARPPDEIQRNRATIQEAYLALGRLIDRDGPLLAKLGPEQAGGSGHGEAHGGGHATTSAGHGETTGSHATDSHAASSGSHAAAPASHAAATGGHETPASSHSSPAAAHSASSSSTHAPASGHAEPAAKHAAPASGHAPAPAANHAASPAAGGH